MWGIAFFLNTERNAKHNTVYNNPVLVKVYGVTFPHLTTLTLYSSQQSVCVCVCVCVCLFVWLGESVLPTTIDSGLQGPQGPFSTLWAIGTFFLK